MKQTALVFAACLALCAGAQESRHSTTLDDQTDLSLTAYNNGLALVRDVRTLSLSTGELRLHFNDVAEQIRPETVSLRSISSPGTVSILEQNYEYDLMSPGKLMEKFVGQRCASSTSRIKLDFRRWTQRCSARTTATSIK